MSKIYTSADQLIGSTPLLELTHIEKKHDQSLSTSTRPAPLRTGSQRQ